MLNDRPIFLNGFTRGGSNILVNFFISHPEICISNGETHKVFKGGARGDSSLDSFVKRIIYDYPIRLWSGQDIFRISSLKERKRISPLVEKYIDRVLYKGRFKCRIEMQNLYRAEGVEYSDQELSSCRLLSKSLNGLVFTADLFNRMYPDACYFALVRNGLAICEGKLRRGFLNTERIGIQYNVVVDKMLKNRERIPNYHIVKYEDMVSKPQDFLRNLYKKANIDLNKLSKVRLESKPIMDKQGVHQLIKGYDHQVFWYELDNLHDHIRTDLNENQIKVLKKTDREEFLAIAGKTMEKLAYEC